MLSTICENEEPTSSNWLQGSYNGPNYRAKYILRNMNNETPCTPVDPFGINSVDTVVDSDISERLKKVSKSTDDNVSKSYLQSNGKCSEEVSLLNNKYNPFSALDSSIKTPAKIWNRISNRRVRRRLVEKSGDYNISPANVPKQKIKFFADIFTTLIELKWRWLLVLFTFSFLISWLLFAGTYYCVMVFHGDFEPENVANESWYPCISNAKNFVSIFLFSLETQHTIGYGSRFPSEKCPAVIVTLCLQSIFGLMIQTLLAGLVFAKLARPQKRAATLIFSKQACICMRDGRMCFLIRVGDMRKSHLAEAHVRMQMISKRITQEGELLPFHQYEMNVGFEAGLDRIFVVWPITICHVIDENSPLYELGAEELTSARFEVVVILEGVVQSGATVQARTSYLPEEILWGYRFEKLVTYQRDNGKYRIDFSKFHKAYAVDTPTLSAKEMDVIRDAGLNFDEVYQCDDMKQVENGGVTPSDSIHKGESSERPSIIDILKTDEECEDSETDAFMPFGARGKRLSLNPSMLLTVECPQDIVRKRRKMSTMSQKLDNWLLPAIMSKTDSNKSLASRTGGEDSQLSLANNNNYNVATTHITTNRRRSRSVLKEHDIM